MTRRAFERYIKRMEEQGKVQILSKQPLKQPLKTTLKPQGRGR